MEWITPGLMRMVLYLIHVFWKYFFQNSKPSFENSIDSDQLASDDQDPHCF